MKDFWVRFIATKFQDFDGSHTENMAAWYIRLKQLDKARSLHLGRTYSSLRSDSRLADHGSVLGKTHL